MLNSSPGVFISSEENLLKCLLALEKLLNTRGRRATILDNGMRALSPREALTLDNIHSHNFGREAVWPTLRFIYEYHHDRLYPGVPLVLWGDKLPAYARELNAALAMPAVRYLHVTRNPLDVVNSMLRRLDAARRGRDWWKAITDFDAMVDAWAEAYRSIKTVEERADVFHLHYEELVFDFERNVAALNQFLGVDLRYQNVLVTDRSLHFDRSHLSKTMVQRIAAHPVVQDYVGCYRSSTALPNVASALETLLN
jgi:hypothetical protein